MGVWETIIHRVEGFERVRQSYAVIFSSKWGIFWTFLLSWCVDVQRWPYVPVYMDNLPSFVVRNTQPVILIHSVYAFKYICVVVMHSIYLIIIHCVHDTFYVGIHMCKYTYIRMAEWLEHYYSFSKYRTSESISVHTSEVLENYGLIQAVWVNSSEYVDFVLISQYLKSSLLKIWEY